MKACVGMKVYLQLSLTSYYLKMSGQFHAPAALLPRKVLPLLIE